MYSKEIHTIWLFILSRHLQCGHAEDTFTLNTQTHHAYIHRTDHSAPADPTSRLTVRQNPGSRIRDGAKEWREKQPPLQP